jgi:hypothetical protein
MSKTLIISGAFVLVVAVVAAIWWMKSGSFMSLPADDRWRVMRSEIGDWSQKDGEATDGLWVALGQHYNISGEAVPPVWRTALGWFKGVNLKPDGWQFKTNLPLQAECTAHIDKYLGTTSKNFEVGQLL